MEFKGVNPTSSGVLTGYHPGVYEFPRTESERFEIILGAILTQNTAWTNAETALFNLQKLEALSPGAFQKLGDAALLKAIRPAGYYNSKSRYLRAVTNFFVGLQGAIPERNELLAVNGIGNETADCILLYAYGRPEFVVDAYTLRLLDSLGLLPSAGKYMDVKNMFERALKPDVPRFQEYHALIVEHSKRFYSKKPYGVGDPLLVFR